MSVDSWKFKILLIGGGAAVEPLLQGQLESHQFVRMSGLGEVEGVFDQFVDGLFYSVVCEGNVTEAEALEIGQLLHNTCPKTPLFFVTDKREGFSPKKFIKNGYSGAFLFPLDREVLKQKILDSVSPEELKGRAFRGVRPVDLSPGTELNFSTYVFLPLNKKYVQFAATGTTLDQEKHAKLEQYNHGRIYLDQKDMAKFFDYTAGQLLAMGSVDNKMSETEREEKLQDSVRTLFLDIMDQGENATLESGKELLSNFQNIVSSYITQGSGVDWYARLVRSMGGVSGGYSKAAGVSSIAALIGIGLGRKNVEDLAIAGLVCDYALADIPSEIQDTPPELWPADFKKVWESHPQLSINIIKNKKLVVSAEAEKAILQHHERFDGKGFPSQKAGLRIPEEAQILSFALQFFEQTMEVEGRTRQSPLEAAEAITRNGSIGPELGAKIRRLFMAKTR